MGAADAGRAAAAVRHGADQRADRAAAALWQTDLFLALLVSFFALIAPYLKTIGLALVHFGLAHGRFLPLLTLLGKLAMADIFLIALYITVIKGIGVGRIETLWGLYLFSFSILASLACSILTNCNTPKQR